MDTAERIPYGETIYYADLAHKINRPLAFQAVANANGKNQLAIVIPCNRVINANNHTGGYRGGIERKQRLISHEMQNSSQQLEPSLVMKRH